MSETSEILIFVFSDEIERYLDVMSAFLKRSEQHLIELVEWVPYCLYLLPQYVFSFKQIPAHYLLFQTTLLNPAFRRVQNLAKIFIFFWILCSLRQVRTLEVVPLRDL